MSVFKVQLIPAAEASAIATDSSATNGVSIQRTMDVTGPNLARRRLYDGATFTDCNYWLRYASTAQGGLLSPTDAFINVLTNDGTPWDDHNPAANTFVVVIPKTTVIAGSTYAANLVNILGTYGGYAESAIIQTTGNAMKMQINGSSSAIMDVAIGTLTFEKDEFILTSLAFDDSASGSVNATYEITLSIRTQPTS